MWGETMKTNVSIEGLHCTGCKALIEDIASDIPGIASCSVDIKKGRAMIEHDGADLVRFKKEVESAGKYKVKI